MSLETIDPADAPGSVGDHVAGPSPMMRQAAYDRAVRELAGRNEPFNPLALAAAR